MGESGVDNSLFWSQVSILRDCYLQYTKFMSLSKKESVNVIGPIPVQWMWLVLSLFSECDCSYPCSVNVIAPIPVHAAGKQGENKERQSP